MKRLLLIAALLCALPAFGQWQQPLAPTYGVTSCAGSNTTCTITPTVAAVTIPTGQTGGTLGIIEAYTDGPNGLSGITGCNSGAWTVGPNTLVQTAGGNSQQLWYCPNMPAGTPTITATATGGDHMRYVELYRVPWTGYGAIAYDTSGRATNASSLTPSGVALTLTGVQDIVIQGIVFDGTSSNPCPNSGTPNPMINNGYAQAYALNPLDGAGGRGCVIGTGTVPIRSMSYKVNYADGTAPTWTFTSPFTANTSASNAIAFSLTGATPAVTWNVVGTITGATGSARIFADPIAGTAGATTLYASTNSKTAGKMYVSKDGGVTWLAGVALVAQAGQQGLSGAQANPDGTIQVSSFQGTSPTSIYWLDNIANPPYGTPTWTKVNVGAKVATLGLQTAKPCTFVSTTMYCYGGGPTLGNSSLIRSTDNGRSWNIASGTTPTVFANAFRVLYQSTYATYFTTNDHVANAAAVWWSTDTNNFTALSLPPNNTTQADTVVMENALAPYANSPFPNYVMVAFQGSGATANSASGTGLWCYGGAAAPSGSWTFCGYGENAGQTWSPTNLNGDFMNAATNGTNNRMCINKYEDDGMYPICSDDGWHWYAANGGLPAGVGRFGGPKLVDITYSSVDKYFYMSTQADGSGNIAIYKSSVTQDINLNTSATVDCSGSPGCRTININQGVQVLATYTYQDGTTSSAGAACPYPAVNSWNSATPGVATVDSSGNVSPVSAGTSVITNICNGVTSSGVTITVNNTPTLVSIAMSPTSTQTLIQGATTVTTPTCTYSSGPTDHCNNATGYTTDNSACATVAGSGSSTGIITATSTLNQTCTANIGLTIGAIVASPKTPVYVNSYVPAKMLGNSTMIGNSKIIP